MREKNNIYIDRLKKVRNEKGISFRQMAKELGYNSPSSYMYIEQGKIQPSINMMNKISKTLGKSVDYFFKLNIQDPQTMNKE